MNPDRTHPTTVDPSGPRRRAVAWPIIAALTFVAGVFAAGAVWSFREQTALADAAGFHVPWLLPLTLDGFAVAMAAVAWSASLDGRAALSARVGVALGVVGTAASNAAWAWQRSEGDQLTVTIAAGVPVLTMLAFEVLLAEVRRQVQRHRGLPRPLPVPSPRLVALMLAPWSTFSQWRRLTLQRVSPAAQFAQLPTGHNPPVAPGHPDPEPVEVATSAPDTATPDTATPDMVRADMTAPDVRTAGPDTPAGPDIPTVPPVDLSALWPDVHPDSTGRDIIGSDTRPPGQAGADTPAPNPATSGQRAAYLQRRAARPGNHGPRRVSKPKVSTAERARDLLAHQPDITRAELAQQLGVSERHVRRVMSTPADTQTTPGTRSGSTPDTPAPSGPMSAVRSGPQSVNGHRPDITNEH